MNGYRACAVCDDFFDASELPSSSHNLRFPFQLITCFHCDPFDEILYVYDDKDESIDDVS